MVPVLLLSNCQPGFCASPGQQGTNGTLKISAPYNASAQMAYYDEPSTGLRFAYPRLWQARGNPDKDTLVSIAGATAGGNHGELKLTAAADAMDIERYACLAEEFFFKKLDGYKKLQEERIRFGRTWQLRGIKRQIEFSLGDARFSQVWIYFQNGERPLALVFTCPRSQLAALNGLFDSTLSSVEQLSASALRSNAGSSANKQTEQQWSLSAMKVPNDTLCFSYPSGWSVQADRERDPEIQAKLNDLEVKVTGKNSQGLGAELHVSAIRRDPEMSLDQFAHLVEQEHFMDLKERRKLSEERKTFGLQRTEGLSQTMSFTADGLPAKLTAVFFCWTRALLLFVAHQPLERGGNAHALRQSPVFHPFSKSLSQAPLQGCASCKDPFFAHSLIWTEPSASPRIEDGDGLEVL